MIVDFLKNKEHLPRWQVLDLRCFRMFVYVMRMSFCNIEIAFDRKTSQSRLLSPGIPSVQYSDETAERRISGLSLAGSCILLFLFPPNDLSPAFVSGWSDQILPMLCPYPGGTAACSESLCSGQSPDRPDRRNTDKENQPENLIL